jgi:4-amino-4-deoxy-L-arabinose transferase-like glycosyltransferase
MLLERAISIDRGRKRDRAVAADKLVALAAAAGVFLLHAAGNAHYGFFRDELYFIICGRHPAIGYVDQPPVVPLLSAFSQAFGVSLFALRLLPAFFAGLSVYVACRFAFELGGGIFAQILAALVTAVSPELVTAGMRFSPDTLQVWLWPLIALYALRISKGADPRLWLWVGFLSGFAAMAKYSVAFFAFALIAGMLLTPQRRLLANRWFAGGVAIALIIVAPNVWWQLQNGLPMLQLLVNDYGKYLMENPPLPIQQIIVMNPLLSIVWILGLAYLLVRRELRFLGITYIVLIAVMTALKAKNYYPAPIYPYLIAAGAIPLEQWASKRPVLRTAIPALVLLFTIPALPFVMPVLPIKTEIAYQQMVARISHSGVRFHVMHVNGDATPIQYFADMTGWPELTQTVAQVYQSLPESDRAQAAIFTSNFGEASAIDLFGKDYGLPPALSGNNNYWIWGPRGFNGNVTIDVNGDLKTDLKRFREAKVVTVFHNPYAMPYEDNLPIIVCRGIKTPLPALWPQLKDYSYAFKEL